jgi:Holliday junction resolvase
MPNRNYLSGVRLERLLMNQLRLQGYKVARSAGSHGLIDVFAWNDNELQLHQVKNGRKAYTQKDIAELSDMPRPAGVKVFLTVRDGGEKEWDFIPC